MLYEVITMDAFALGLELADRIISDGKLDGLLKKRYASFV